MKVVRQFLQYVWNRLAGKGLVVSFLVLSSCSRMLGGYEFVVKSVTSVNADIDTFTINHAAVTNASPLSITAVASKKYSHYCILENDTDVDHCTWVAGTFPTTFAEASTDANVTLSLWVKTSKGKVSDRADSNTVYVDRVAPSLSTLTVTNSSPTNTPLYSLTWGAITGTYADYCIQANNTSAASCTWVSGTVPTGFTVPNVSATYTLTAWLRDAAGNVSTSIDSNAVAFDNSVPAIATVTVTNSTYTNSTTYNLTYAGVNGPYTEYCILENNTTIGSCSWTAGTLPSSFTVSTTENAKVLTVWIRNASLTASAGTNSNSVTLDTTPPSLTYTAPANAAVLTGGASTNIQWSASDLHLGTTPIKIEVSSDSGSNWTNIVAATANTSPYSWTAPSVTSKTYRIRITATDLAGNTATGGNSADFWINSSTPSITVTAPNGSEYVQGGAARNITWTTSGLPAGTATVGLEYSLDGGSNWTSIATGEANDGTYSWTVPGATNVSTARVRATVTDSFNVNTADTSNANFTIDSTQPTLTINQPNGGESIAAGSTYSISWNTSDTNLATNPITIEVSSNSGGAWSSVASNLAHSGNPTTYSWTVPSTAATTYRIRVTSVDLATNTRVVSSASDFTVYGAPTAPSSLTAVGGISNIALNWTASTGGGTITYEVYRSTTSGSYGAALATGVATNSYTDLTALNGTTYYYTIKAVNAGGTSAASNEASARAISSFTLSAVAVNDTAGGSALQVSWGSATGAAAYTLKYGTSSGTYGTTVSTNATSPTTVGSLTPGTTYYFMVTATNAVGGGASVDATAEMSGVPMAAFTISSATPGTNAISVAWGASTGSSSFTLKYGTSSGTYGTTVSTTATSPTNVTPLAAGTYYFMVQAVNSSGALSATAEVSATLGATLAWSPLTHAFGNINVGANSSNTTFTLSNSGGADATGCSAPTIGDTTNFTIVTDNCGTNNVTAGGNCTVLVRANPASAGAKSTQLSRTCTVGGTVSTTASGITTTGTAPSLTWSPLARVYGNNAYAYGKSGSTTFTLSNSGTGTATGCSAPTLGGPNPSEFEITIDNCGTNDLAAGASCTVFVRTNLTGLGPKTAALSRTCTFGGITSANLNATGVATAPSLVATSALQLHTDRFMSARNFSMSTTEDIHFTNPGTADATGCGAPAITGANTGDFVLVSHDCGATIPVGGHCTAKVYGRPLASGARNASIGITCGASNASLTLKVTGNGFADPVQLALGGGSSGGLALMSDGTVMQVGSSTMNLVTTYDAATTAAQVVTGGNFSCIRRTGGTVQCWGVNADGQLGNGSFTDSSTQVTVSGLTNVIWVAAAKGEYHACAVKSDGTVWCWGNNDAGQLGNNSTTDSNVPVQATGVTQAVEVYAMEDNTCALLSTGGVQCWGANNRGQIGDGTTTARLVPTTVKTNSSTNLTGVRSLTMTSATTVCAVMNDGTIKCWGGRRYGYLMSVDQSYATTTTGINTATAIAMGYTSACALLSDGTVKCWGENGKGELGDGTTIKKDYTSPVTVTGLSGVASLYSDNWQGYCAILTNKSVKCWGDRNSSKGDGGIPGSQGIATAQAGLASVTQVAAGEENSCALISDGTVKCWGGWARYEQAGRGHSNYYVNVSTPTAVPTLTNATQIAASDYTYCALISGGSVKCWGHGNYGQRGDGTNVDFDGTVYSTSGITTATQIAGGRESMCALLSDGTVRCWGYNNQGQLGDGTISNRNTPVAVSGLTGATAVYVGKGSFACAIVAGGAIKCWGRNGRGELGDGTTTNSSTPVNVVGVTNAVSMALGQEHSCALISDGTARCWGYNNSGQLGDGTTTNSLAPVNISFYSKIASMTALSYGTCAILTDNTVRCWGSNWAGSLGTGNATNGNPATSAVYSLANATQIAAGGSQVCARLSGGTVSCWGLDTKFDLTLRSMSGFTQDPNAPVISPMLAAAETYGNAPLVASFTLTDGNDTLTCSSSHLSMSSSSTGIVPTANVVWGGTYPNCTATITAASATTVGSSTITITASDGTYSDSDSFVMTVKQMVITGPVNVHSVVIADFDQDGNMDIVGASDPGGAYAQGLLSVYYGNGNGGYSLPLSIMNGTTVTQNRVPQVVDVNLDGYPDIVTQIGMGYRIFFNNGAVRTFGAVPTDITPTAGGQYGFEHFAVVDYDNNGKLDFIYGTNYVATTSNRLVIRLHDATTSYATANWEDNTTETVIAQSNQYGHDIDAVDLNGDGNKDIIASYYGAVRVFWGDGSSGYTSSTDVLTKAGGGAHECTGIGDVDNDGDLDLFVSFWDLAVMTVLKNDGTGSFTAADYTLPSINNQACNVADLNKDGYADFMAISHVTDRITILYSNGAAGTLDDANPVTHNSVSAINPSHPSVGDLNGDSCPDIAWGSEMTSSQIQILYNRGPAGGGQCLKTFFGI